MMERLSLRAAAYVTPLFVLLVTITVLMIGASDALAYEDYAAGCDDCHGGFRDNPYISLSDGANWGDDLHDVHRNTMLGGDCSTCHAATGGFSPVLLESSAGGNGLAPISCVGCHGRDADNGNATSTGTSQRGAGLRQHHAGFANCAGCHNDQTGYTPVGENILPNYYANPGTNHPAMPTNSCNPSGGEDFAGTALGLDNDGDGIYDTADLDCGSVVDTDGDGDPDVTDPDDDNDGIGDALDNDPLVANNFCIGGDAYIFSETVVGLLTCAATTSITAVSLAEVQATGDLHLIAPIAIFESGFSVAGLLKVTSADPCPGCSP